MGMEVGSDIVNGNSEIKVAEGIANLHANENGVANSVNGTSEPIKFGSHGADESGKGNGEAETKSISNFPKDAVEDWPAPKQIHSFYLVKYRSYEDPSVKAKLDQADKEFGKRNQQRFQLIESLKAKKSVKFQIIDQLKALGVEKDKYYTMMEDKRKDMKPLQDALGNLRNPNGSVRNPNGSGRERGMGLCSSEEELNECIQSLQYRIQHEVIALTEEKQLLREIKQLESTRQKVIAHAAERAQIQEKYGQKETIQDQVKLMGSDIDGVRKEQQGVKAKINKLKEELGVIQREIDSIQEELDAAAEKKDKAMETIQKMRKQRDEMNACFYQNRALLNNSKELAAKKNVKALEELALAEVEKFMASWNSSKAFRNDYERRILASLDIRQLSRDGRMRNPNEKPLVLVDNVRTNEQEAPAKSSSKPGKEDSKPLKEPESVPTQKSQKESKKKPAESKLPSAPLPAEEEEEDFFVVENHKKDAPNDKVIDEAKLKEMKREEEMAKQRQALERKKKLAEKNAAKAALRAQKEAEKKQKDREKKLKKKEAASSQPSNEDETTVEEPEAAEPTDEEKAETQAPVNKSREVKETPAIRSRTRTKARENLPKVILKRKKSNKYWMWAVPMAAVVVGLLALLYIRAF